MTSCVGPVMTVRPRSKSRHRWQNSATVFKLWETNKTVAPLWITSFMRSTHLTWNAWSPTLRTSSTINTSGSTCAATENPSLANIPEEYRFTGVSMNSSIPEKAMIWSSFDSISRLVMPRIVP